MEQDTLKRTIRNKITIMMEDILDYVQIAVATPDTYKVIRGKILRVSNNCMRNVDKEFDKITGGITNDRR